MKRHPMEKRRKPASESLRALHEFLLGPEEDIRDVPLESIKAELKKEGIDTDPMVREIRKRLADAAADYADEREMTVCHVATLIAEEQCR